MPSPEPAVFLSYTSKDAAIAERIRQALRDVGVQVWFDRKELVGGDAWDAKIRQEIATCALFIPIISSSTQARREGYFRVEWNLAAQRAVAMADGASFLLPVVVDATSEAEAWVPPEFKTVQWTRLMSGVANRDFVARVRHLVGTASPATTGAMATAAPTAANPEDGHGPAERSAAPRLRTGEKSSAKLVAGILAALLGFGGLAAFVLTRKSPTSDPTPPVAPVAAPAAAAGPAGAAVNASRLTLAILPFTNLSPDPDNRYFAEGMQEEMITAIGKIGAWTVIGRTSVAPYAEPQNRSLAKIASELKVGTVIEGTVRRSGNRVRVTIQLTDTTSGRQLWAETYERELTDVFAIQSAVAVEVSRQLRVVLTGDQVEQLATQPTDNLRAYDLYLQARVQHDRLTAFSPRAEWDHTITLLEDAVAADPSFVPALSLLVRTHARMFWHGGVDPNPERYARARRHLDSLLRQAPTAPETLHALAYFTGFADLRWAEALPLYERAALALPNEADLFRVKAWVHFELGQTEEALAALRKAETLNPRDLQTKINQAIFYASLRRHDAIIALAATLPSPLPEAAVALSRTADLAQFELDGDVAHYAQQRRTRATTLNGVNATIARYEAALMQQNWPAAREALLPMAEGSWTFDGSGAPQPIALHLAYIAYVSGDPAAAQIAAPVIAALRRKPAGSARTAPFEQLDLARALTYAGEKDEPRRLALELRAKLAQIGQGDRAILTLQLGRLFALLDLRDEALACLDEITRGPTSPYFGSPNAIRRDACWSRVSSDPRFETSLKNARAR